MMEIKALPIATSVFVHLVLAATLWMIVRHPAVQGVTHETVYAEIEKDLPSGAQQVSVNPLQSKAAKKPPHKVRRRNPVPAAEMASKSAPSGPASIAQASGKSGSDAGKAASFAEELRVALDHCKEYPALAKARKQSCRVGVGFTVKKNGKIINARVISPCVFDKLNEAAIQTVTRLGSFKPVPDSVSMNDWNVMVPIDFKLE